MREVLALNPNSWAIEFEGESYSWGELAQSAEAVSDALSNAGAAPYDVVGWAAQNCPEAISSLCGILLSEHCAATLNPHMAPKILCAELLAQRFPIIVGDADFWAIEGVAAAAKEAGSAGIITTAAKATPYPGLEQIGPGPHRQPLPGFLFERISSGTTGPPKRTPQAHDTLLDMLTQGERKEQGPDREPLQLKRSPTLIFRPLAHAGSFSTLLSLFAARPIVLQKKFSVESTVNAVQRHRTRVLQIVPAMIKMIWDADVPVEALSSLIAIRSGTAPLDPALQERFEAKYGIPILIDYGASEFGGVTAWTLADHRQFAESKRGSVGRAAPGARIRVIDQTSREEISDGSIGLLAVQVDRKGPDWIVTNDLSSIDEDGFLYIHGRADDAIVRGGFKILPEEIENVLREHPDVGDVAVVGVPDARLGQVPVAVIEIRRGGNIPSEDALRSFARDRLTPYQVPAAFKFVDGLPRTPSLKFIRAEVLALAMN